MNALFWGNLLMGAAVIAAVVYAWRRDRKNRRQRFALHRFYPLASVQEQEGVELQRRQQQEAQDDWDDQLWDPFHPFHPWNNEPTTTSVMDDD